MQIDTFILGEYQTNCYVCRHSSDDKDCFIIDPGFSAQVLIDFLKAQALVPTKIILTHGHSDHIAGIPLLHDHFGRDLKVWSERIDAAMLTDNALNLSAWFGDGFSLDPPDVIFNVGDTLEACGIQLEVLSTPGHTAGGVSLYVRADNIVFSGDALFAGSIGRTDFPGGNHDILIAGIKSELLTLDEVTIVYSGHGPATSIGMEKRVNPYLR